MDSVILWGSNVFVPTKQKDVYLQIFEGVFTGNTWTIDQIKSLNGDKFLVGRLDRALECTRAYYQKYGSSQTFKKL